MIEAKGYAAFDDASPLRAHTFSRRDPGDRDVVIDIAFCGVCHSDLHQAKNEWGGSKYPMVPGHEIVGIVKRVGAHVKKHAVGDHVGIGCFVAACGACEPCKRGLQQYCDKHTAWTYNGTEMDEATPTQGGYSTVIVAHEDYVLKVRKEQPLDRVAPLLCAGITTYSPLRHWKVGKGTRVGVVGLGGLGHMGVKLAAAMGAHVTVLSTSASKKADAERLGAHDFLVTSDPKAFKAAKNRFEFLLDTVSAPHDLAAYAGLLRLDGVMCLVGVPDKPATLPAYALIGRRRSITGSLIGGIEETQEMLDFCADRNITADVEVLPMAQINEAYARMLKSDVRYRFVLDPSRM
ncbi:MAG: NAD(P)-dependent alcohol dehydrogenase [Polyangiales bacterium]